MITSMNWAARTKKTRPARRRSSARPIRTPVIPSVSVMSPRLLARRVRMHARDPALPHVSALARAVPTRSPGRAAGPGRSGRRPGAGALASRTAGLVHSARLHAAAPRAIRDTAAHADHLRLCCAHDLAGVVRRGGPAYRRAGLAD